MTRTRLSALRTLQAGAIALCFGTACNASHEGGSLAGEGGSQAGEGGTQAGASGGAGQSGGAGGSVSCVREPREHRPEREPCDRVRPAGDMSMEASAVPCASDADCIDGINGRCEDQRGPTCTYDECFADDECSSGGPCGCEMGFWSDANACMDGNCQIDADCGEGGFCSPTFGTCGNYSGVTAYYCHTCEDECLDDSECVDPAMGSGYCMYSPEVAHWICSYSSCVG